MKAEILLSQVNITSLTHILVKLTSHF